LEKSAYRGEKKLLTVQRKKSLPRGEKTAYRVVVKTPYHPHKRAYIEEHNRTCGEIVEEHHAQGIKLLNPDDYDLDE